MKILFLNHNFEGFGTYYRCLNLAKYLARMDCQVSIICASRYNFDLGIKIKKINDNLKIITLPRIRAHKYHTGHILRGLIAAYLSIISDFDIFHSFAVAQPATAIPTLLYKSIRRKPVVVDWDDDWTMGLAKFHPLPVRLAVGFLERSIPKAADKMTVVSDYLMDKAQNFYPRQEDIVKISNGAEVEAIKPMDRQEARRHLGIDPQIPILVAVGHSYIENRNMLFEVFSKVQSKKPDARLYIVGNSGISPEDINDYQKNFGDSIVFSGEQPYPKIPYYLNMADVLVLPMGDTELERSRWPIRFGDYMASGRAIVSNAVGEVKKVLEEDKCGLCSHPSDLDSFARNILKVLNDDSLKRELGVRARQAAENKYSWEGLAQKLKQLYLQLLTDR